MKYQRSDHLFGELLIAMKKFEAHRFHRDCTSASAGPSRRTVAARLAAIGALSAAIATSAAGCVSGGIDAPAGGHSVLRISRDEVGSQSGECGNTTTDTSDRGDADTWLLYGVAGTGSNTPYLDTGSQVYKGGFDGVTYTFRGTEKKNDDKGSRVESESTMTGISLIPEGKTVTGTYTITTTDSCSGNCNGVTGGTCSVTKHFVGVVIERASDAP